MFNKKTITLFSGIFMLLCSLQAQDPVLVTNVEHNPGKEIHIKWFADPLIFPRGINVYRQTTGKPNWELLTPRPLRKGDYQPNEAELAADDNLIDYIDIVRDIQQQDLEGLIKALILVKAVQSSPYARFIGIEYHDTDVVQDTTYRYRIMEATSRGERLIGYSPYIKAGEHVPVEPPEDIEALESHASVAFKWKPEPLRFYAINIYRKAAHEEFMKKLNPVPVMIAERPDKDGELAYPDIFFKDDSLEIEVTYTYQLVALDFFGREGVMSEPMILTPRDTIVPLAPINLGSRVQNANIILNWTNRESPKFIGVNIYRSEKHEGPYYLINERPLSKETELYIDQPPKAGGYYYYVTAVDEAGKEGLSQKTFAETRELTPPPPPKNLVAIADTGVIRLEWDANTEENVLGYRVYRSVKNDKKMFALVNTSPISPNSFIDSLPKVARNNFYYAVAAVDIHYNVSNFSNITQARMPDILPPVQPRIRNISQNNSYLVIEWIPNVEPDLAGYEIFRYTGENEAEIQKINVGLLSPSVSRYTDRDVNEGMPYNYLIIASDSAGNKSVPSPVFQASLVLETEMDEDYFKRFSASYRERHKEARLTWNMDGKSRFVGFIVYRGEAEDQLFPLSSLIKDATYTDKGCHMGTYYYYQIRAYMDDGEVYYSEIKEVQIKK